MGMMLLAKGVDKVIEYGNATFKDFQKVLVTAAYSNRAANLYTRFDSLSDKELSEWKKLTNANLNKLLFIEDRLELTPAQIKKILPLLESVNIVDLKLRYILDYIKYLMNHCITNNCNLIFMKR